MNLSLTSLTLTLERKVTMVYNDQGMKGYSDVTMPSIHATILRLV